MFNKVFRLLAYVFLIFLPFLPVLEAIVGSVDANNLLKYAAVCLIISLIIYSLAFFISYAAHFNIYKQSRLIKATFFLFALGAIVMVPLHMGPPKESETLLTFATLEKFRYAMLLFAVLIFAIGMVLVISSLWINLSVIEKALIIPLILAILISLWDNYDSFMFSSKLTDWINSGKNASDFFPNYNFHEMWRAFGRILLYIVTACASFILCKQTMIKKWIMITLNLFCLFGIVFCIAFLWKGQMFYFPFMVPAIVMAPAYWLGIALLNNKRYRDNVM